MNELNQILFFILGAIFLINQLIFNWKISIKNHKKLHASLIESILSNFFLEMNGQVLLILGKNIKIRLIKMFYEMNWGTKIIIEGYSDGEGKKIIEFLKDKKIVLNKQTKNIEFEVPGIQKIDIMIKFFTEQNSTDYFKYKFTEKSHLV